MADWEAPLDSQTDPDAPITSQLGKRWDNNTVAIAEGAPGAPRLRLGALGTLSAGDFEAVLAATEINQDSSVIPLEFSFIQSGTVRLKWEQKADSSTSKLFVYRDRGSSYTLLGTYNPGKSWESRSIDVPVIIGDTLRITIAATTENIYARNVAICTGGEYVWPGVALNRNYSFAG